MLTNNFTIADGKQKIIFFISQSNKGNGGVESITMVIETLKLFQSEFQANE